MGTSQIPGTLPPAITISRETTVACLADDLADYGTTGPVALAWQWALTGNGPHPHSAQRVEHGDHPAAARCLTRAAGRTATPSEPHPQPSATHETLNVGSQLIIQFLPMAGLAGFFARRPDEVIGSRRSGSQPGRRHRSGRGTSSGRRNGGRRAGQPRNGHTSNRTGCFRDC
jgi:hypothetical protein